MQTALIPVTVLYTVCAVLFAYQAELWFDAEPDYDKAHAAAKTGLAVFIGILWLPLFIVGLLILALQRGKARS